MELLARNAPQRVDLVVDLGCGTGRFTGALAEALAARVIAVEPADNMRAVAEAKPNPASVCFVPGRADDIPLEDEAADLVFMSQVVHHLPDLPQALREIRRVLRPEGRLCIRQTTRENLDSYYYQRFFPEARAVDEQRLPHRASILSLAESSQYRSVALETVRHEIASTSLEYVERIALRAYSDLEAITDAAFRKGLMALRHHCETNPDHPKFAENDLFTWKKVSTSADRPLKTLAEPVAHYRLSRTTKMRHTAFGSRPDRTGGA